MSAPVSRRTSFRCISLLLLIVGATLLSHLAGAATPQKHKHEYRHEVEQLEEQWRSAMVNVNSDAMGKLLADDYTGIGANGAIQTRDQALMALRSGAIRLTSLTISDRKVRIYGSTAVVTSQAELEGTREAQSISGKYRYTRVYVRNGQGQWKIVSFEASRIQENGDHR